MRLRRQNRRIRRQEDTEQEDKAAGGYGAGG
jgi:hypothetical protein